MKPDIIGDRKFCYGLLPSDLLPGHDPEENITPIIIIEGEMGYYPTTWAWQRKHAEAARDEMNAKLGITPEDAVRMMVRSMPLGAASR